MNKKFPPLNRDFGEFTDVTDYSCNKPSGDTLIREFNKGKSFEFQE